MKTINLKSPQLNEEGKKFYLHLTEFSSILFELVEFFIFIERLKTTIVSPEKKEEIIKEIKKFWTPFRTQQKKLLS